ncbi:MAG: hypothetical protein COA36_16405 [Desulfotalea sp.]|nr:MAG: hypothetical protein COA36_16405 [Desulfotalea sp.]
MKLMTVEGFHEVVKEQNVSFEHYSFVCPQCGTVQSAENLINAGLCEIFDQVQKYLAFSCVGRFTGASSPRKENDSEPCNWTFVEHIKVREKHPITVFAY